MKKTERKKKAPAKNGASRQILSDILPLPTPRFRGRIGSTYADSEADVIHCPRLRRVHPMCC
jgi:hypothetical protein